MKNDQPSPPEGLKLERPLVVFDIESTGTNRRFDRIIDLALIMIHPDGHADSHTFRFNPERPIPPESTAIHGIRDEDVKDAPTFKQSAAQVATLLKDCDFAGYNISGFDIPILCEEFARVGVPFETEGRRVLDAQRIFHRKVPRDLPAALQYYCGEMHLTAHNAMGDVQATLRVIESQFERYPDLPKDMDGLDAFCNPRDPTWVDRTGKFRWVEGEATLNFGKKQGARLRDLVRDDTGFLQWMLKSDFPRDVQTLVRNALNGVMPKPPEAAP